MPLVLVLKAAHGSGRNVATSDAVFVENSASWDANGDVLCVMYDLIRLACDVHQIVKCWYCLVPSPDSFDYCRCGPIPYEDNRRGNVTPHFLLFVFNDIMHFAFRFFSKTFCSLWVDRCDCPS
jgi:hypothetical protein